MSIPYNGTIIEKSQILCCTITLVGCVLIILTNSKHQFRETENSWFFNMVITDNFMRLLGHMCCATTLASCAVNILMLSDFLKVTHNMILTPASKCHIWPLMDNIQFQIHMHFYQHINVSALIVINSYTNGAMVNFSAWGLYIHCLAITKLPYNLLQ